MAATSDVFVFPLGYHDGQTYAPRVMYDPQGNLIENTDFDAQNPDLSAPSSCFGPPMRQLHHAGEDLYRDGQDPIEGAEVVAVADGVVIEYNPRFNYPGKTVVIEHTLSDGARVYSVYMHLRDVQVQEEEHVFRGETIGYVIRQAYTGNYPEYHSDDDSHLHFEIRHFADASQVYLEQGYPRCARWRDKAGRGYTPPDVHADAWGYTDPTDFILAHQPPTPTPSFTPTPTPTPSNVVTVQVRIASGPEDAGPEPSACAYATSWNEIYFGECADGSLITSGFRFGNVPVLQNAQIIEAYLEFTVDGPYDVPLQVRIYGEASGDAQPFSDTDRPENRPRTQASALWTIPAADHWELGMTRRTPDLAALVREIVSRPDWQAYHGMGFIFETASSVSGRHRRVIGYERPVWYPGSEHAARLVIRHAGAIPPTPTPTPTPTPGPCVLQAMQAQVPGLQDLELFYQARNKLIQTPAGQRYVELYYRYSPALIRLLQEDEEVRQAFGEALQLWQPALRAWAQGKEARLHRGQIVALQRFLKLLAERGEPSLRAAVVQEMERIPWARLAGMRVSEVEALLLGTGEAPQGMPVPTGTPRP